MCQDNKWLTDGQITPMYKNLDGYWLHLDMLSRLGQLSNVDKPDMNLKWIDFPAT